MGAGEGSSAPDRTQGPSGAPTQAMLALKGSPPRRWQGRGGWGYVCAPVCAYTPVSKTGDVPRAVLSPAAPGVFARPSESLRRAAQARRFRSAFCCFRALPRPCVSPARLCRNLSAPAQQPALPRGAFPRRASNVPDGRTRCRRLEQPALPQPPP